MLIGNPAPACMTELSLFASGRAPMLDRGPAWTATKDVIPEALPPRGTCCSTWSWSTRGRWPRPRLDANRATALFDLNHMGSGFTIDGAVTSIDPDTDPLAAAIRGGCETTATQTALRRATA